jgi:hypothetical protein
MYQDSLSQKSKVHRKQEARRRRKEEPLKEKLRRDWN